MNEFSKFTVELPLSGTPSFTADAESYPASRGSVTPGMVFHDSPEITAQDAPNAAKLAGLGFAPAKPAKWAEGAFFSANSYKFHWSGTAWGSGPAPA